MVPELIVYLRDLAQTCTRLARVCPHAATSHGLQEIALDLTAKANELRESQPKLFPKARGAVDLDRLS